MSSVEQNHAYKWAKSRHSGSTFISATSSPINLEHLVEEMAFWKKKLLATDFTAQPDGTAKKEKIIDRLIDLRARQTMAFIQDIHETKHPLAKPKIDQAIIFYYADCIKLIAAANRL